MVKVSVIIPVYNKKRYLDALFQCLSEQSFKDYECLIIDDGSTDGSGEICDKYAQKDDRLKVFHMANGGVSHARNIGLDNSSGEYITFIDSDDTFHKDYLLNLHNCITDSNADMVISGAKKVWNDNREELIQSGYFGLKSIDEIMPEFAKIQNSTGIYGFCVSKILAKNIIGDTRFNEQIKLAEDLDFYLSIYPKISTVFFDDKCYYYYLQEADNSSAYIVRDDYKIDYLTQLNINIKYKNFLIEKNSYNGKNREIVDSIIMNYIFFSLFYVKMDSFSSVFEYVQKIANDNQIELNGTNWKQKFFFNCLKTNCKFLPKLYLKSYRTVRALKRR
ncbi:MAG: glycosyltransferase family 2 protein [Clostridia bacterium]|nr:glycosyltransferase family 2 protein [Clostridia bacterium]